MKKKTFLCLHLSHPKKFPKLWDSGALFFTLNPSFYKKWRKFISGKILNEFLKKICHFGILAKFVKFGKKKNFEKICAYWHTKSGKIWQKKLKKSSKLSLRNFFWKLRSLTCFYHKLVKTHKFLVKTCKSLHVFTNNLKKRKLGAINLIILTNK